MKKTDTHYYFLKGWESNFKRATIRVFDQTFLTTEHAFMYAKAVYFKDYETAAKVLVTVDAQEAKGLGRQVKGFVKEEWDKVSYSYMLIVNTAKYEQHADLAAALLATDDLILVEANPGNSHEKPDIIWGCGLGENDPKILDQLNWTGTNWLGQVLMEIRKFLKSRS